MDALLTTFIAAGLAEFGDKTQLLAVALGLRYRRTGAVLAGIFLAALLNALLASAGGVLINGMVTPRAISLFVALALVFAGLGGVFRAKMPAVSGLSKGGAFAASATLFFITEIGDKTQFLTAAFAARSDSLLLAAAGATAGVVAASVPAVALAERFTDVVPLRPLRMGIAALFLIVGFLVAISALRLT